MTARSPFLPLLVMAVALVAVGFKTTDRANEVPEGLEMRQHATFAIWQGERKLGTEEIRIYSRNDTLFAASELDLEVIGAQGPYRYQKRMTYLTRALDSYPLSYNSVDLVDRDSMKSNETLCAFADTHVVVFLEGKSRFGRAESLGLPPGRIYILDPGIFLQVQLLAADFLDRAQAVRRQAVLFPASPEVREVELRKGPREEVLVGGKKRKATRVDLQDSTVTLRAWLDDRGRMLLLRAEDSKMRVERGPEQHDVVEKKTAKS